MSELVDGWMLFNISSNADSIDVQRLDAILESEEAIFDIAIVYGNV